MAWNTRRRTQRLGTSPSQQQRIHRAILERDQWTCWVCGQTGADQVDHKRPLFEGGTNDPANLAAIHATPCHRDKSKAEARRAHPRGPRPAGTTSKRPPEQHPGIIR